MSLVVVPCPVKTAMYWVSRFHRTHPRVVGGMFAAALVDGGVCVAVGIAGRPKARALDDGTTLEITRIATPEGTRNACSMLYGSLRGAARCLGYRRVFTYTLASEPGTSLRAAGFREDAVVKGRSWTAPSRPREDKHPTCDKRRWVWERK